MSGRGLEAISSNVHNSAIKRPILFKLVVMTSVGGGVRVLVVHYCISLIIHDSKGLTFIPSESVRYHYKSTTQYPVILILGC